MRAVALLALLLQVPDSPGIDELARIRGLRTEDPANGRLAFTEGRLALDAGQLSEAMSAFNDAVELLEGPGDLARAHHAVAVAQHQSAMSQVAQNPALAKEFIASAIANYALALEYDPKLDPARRNGERAAQFASQVPPPPPESSGGEGENQDDSSESTEPTDDSPSDASPSPDQLNPTQGEPGDQNEAASNQDSPSSPESNSDPSRGSTESLSEEEARRMLQEIRDRADERQEELSARQSRSRVVERDW